MAPILKDSDTLTAPETMARSRSATESAGKAQPIALEVPITVNGVRTIEGSDKREPFSESTKTVMVHGSGAVIRLTTAMAPGQLLFLTNEHTKKEVVCQVLKSKNYRNASGYVELEFTEPAVGFWGMRFPGDRIGPVPQAAPAETRAPAAADGASAPVPARPAAPRTEQPTAGSVSAASTNEAKPSAPAPSVVKPAAGSSIVPPPIHSAATSDASKAKADASVRATPAPVATSLGADTPLIEPWLKKREPAPRVPAAPPSMAPPRPSAKPVEPESSLTPVRSFAVERPSEKAASLFSPAEAPANLSSVDLSSITPFFEVKPLSSDATIAPPKPPAASDPETEQLKQQTARLQDELAKMQFSETASNPTVKADAEKPAAPKLATPPDMEIPSFPLTERSIETLKTELVHGNAVRLVENPEPTNEAPVLPELSKLDEPVRAETPAAIPALESLEHEEMKIPAWLEPLARNSSAPSSTLEVVSREKSKRRLEQPHLQELVAPLAAPKEEKRSAEARVPQFGSTLPFEGATSARQSSAKKSGKGLMVGGIAAGILALAGGGWWYMHQQAAGTHSNIATAGSIAGSGPAASQTNPIKESVLGTARRQADTTVSETKAADVSSNAPSNPANNGSGAASANSSASSTRGMQGNSDGLNGGNLVTKADATEPAIAHVVEKKPALGVVHLAAPKISQKRTVQAGAAPDAGILNEEQPSAGADAASLGGLAVAGNQPATPAVPAAPAAVGGDVRQAKLISSVPPAYPALAKAEHVSGAVTIDALIDANGRVTAMKVISGPALLLEAAKEALQQWKYQPAMLDGKAVSMHLTVTIQFRLQ